jgi:serine protease Do
MKQSFYGLCLALLLAILITACGGPATTPTAAPTAVPPTAVPPTAVPPTPVPPTATSLPPTAEPTALPPTQAPEYVTVKDDTGAFEVTIPSSWTEVDGKPTTDEYPSAQIFAAPSTAEFQKFTGPGAYMLASTALAKAGGYIQILDLWKDQFALPNGCKFDSRNDVTDPMYEGKYDLYINCMGAENEALLITVARPKSDPTGYVIMMAYNLPDATDENAMNEAEKIINSFKILGDLPK